MIRNVTIGLLLMTGVALAQTATEPKPLSKLLLAPQLILDLARAAHGANCDFEGESGPDERYKFYELTYKSDGDAPDQAANKAILHEVFCFSGAYNISYIYLIALGDEAPRPLQFAVPAFRPIYENDDTEKAVLRIDIQGFTTADTLVNPTYDATTGIIISANRWRGIGDAGTNGTWRFLQGNFTLTHFDVDASYDGEINPTAIYDAAPETP